MRMTSLIATFTVLLVSCAFVPAQEAPSHHLLTPTGVTVDASNNVFIAEAKGYRVLKQGVVFAGNGNPCMNSTSSCGDGGPAVAAQLNLPTGVAIGINGDVYIADSKDNRIRKVDHSTGIIFTVAGTGIAGFGGDGGPAIAAELNRPFSVSIDSFGNLYIADTGNDHIRLVNTAGIIVTIY